MGMDNMKQADAVMTKKRPVERQKMRPWLQDMLDQGGVQGLEWFDKLQNQFRITWKHGSRHGFNTTKDACLFEKYAQHTGRWDPKDPNPKKWKANFRCALNSLQNVMEMKNLGESKGAHAYRVYQFLQEEETKPKCNMVNQRKQNKKKPNKEKTRKYVKSDDTTDEEPEKETDMNDQEIEEPTSTSSEEGASHMEASLLTKPEVHSYTYQHHMAGCIVREGPRKRPVPYSKEEDDCEDPMEMTSPEGIQLMAHTEKRRRKSTDDDESMSFSQPYVTDDSSNISCTSVSSSSSRGEEPGDNMPHFSNLLSGVSDDVWVIGSEETVTTTQL